MTAPLAVRAGIFAGTIFALAPPSVPHGGDSAALPSYGQPGAFDADDVLVLRAPSPRMLLLRGGTFTMGSTDDDLMSAFAACQAEPLGPRCDPSLFADEGPAHRVTLSAFWLDATEVTVSDYARCVGARRCAALPLGEGARRFDRPRFPASLVTWDEARTFCEFRGARLPTEAEFERAARGPGTPGRRYPWGNGFHSFAANHGRLDWDKTDGTDGARELAEVGAYPAGRTKEGVLDLAGNVAEWVHDRYANRYPPEDAVDPTGPEPPLGGVGRVVRGGSYEEAGPWLRGAARSAAAPGARLPSIGFRCAKSDHPPPRG